MLYEIHAMHKTTGLKQNGTLQMLYEIHAMHKTIGLKQTEHSKCCTKYMQCIELV